MKKYNIQLTIFVAIASLLLSACNKSTPQVTKTMTNLNTDTVVITKTSTAPPTATATPTPERDLTIGVEGDDVQILQSQLLALNYYEVGRQDGFYDIQDEAAVRHFQLLNNLPITGIVDEVTRGAFASPNPAPYYLPPVFPGKVAVVNTNVPVCDDHALQDRLAILGYIQPGSEEWSIGAFGSETKNALVEFQKQYMSTANGKPDLQTWKTLFSPIPQWTSGGAQAVVEKWSSVIFPADPDVVALAWDGSRLWMAVSKGGSVYDNFLIRIDPGAHPAEAVMVIRPRDCETLEAQIANMVFAGGKIWLLYATDGDGNPAPLIQTVDPETGIAHTPFQFANCPDGYCFPASAMGVANGQVWATAGDRAYAIDSSSGRVIISRPVGFMAAGKMVFDGQCFLYMGESTVSSFNPQGGSCRAADSITALSYGFPETDGTQVWTINSDGSLSQLNLNTGVSIFTDPVSSSPSALAFGKKHLWIADNYTNTIIGMSSDGSLGDEVQLNGENPTLLLQESNNLWVYFQDSSSVEKIVVDNYQVKPFLRTPTPVFTVTPSPTPPVLTRSLFLTTPNHQGDDVLLLQNRLLSLGFTELGVPDGSFGQLTDKAVRRFQKEKGLVVDGIVGPLTWNKLFGN
ncbi:MAG: peptidoglycan-binding domain-containing protein [Chloroflexi bacterium]|nr:MAG: peptidoglycan-binding domain-containing protein [Chloroflexota bacterium]MBA4374728.1 hypothetical protein [Anaerolinea sp.]